MADFLNDIPLPENRQALEDMIEALIARLDAADGNPDLEDGNDAEPCCEDEGALCDDEGWQDDQESEGPLDAVRHWPCNPISFGATP